MKQIRVWNWIWKPLGLGFLVLFPVGLIIAILMLFFRFTDGILSPLLHGLIHWTGRIFHIPFLMDLFIPGLGLVVLVFLLYGTGLLYLSRFGKWVVGKAEFMVKQIPFIGSVYSGSQILVHALFGSDHQKERIPVLAETQPGQIVVGFQTGRTVLEEKGCRKDVTAVYVPTTPNPTSGNLLFLPSSQITPLEMSIEEAMNLVLSAGLTLPSKLKR